MAGAGPAGLDPARLRAYLAEHRPDLAGDVRATLITGGRSNLTYHVRVGARDLVLRRPPLGHVLATAHDMGREYRVITALAGTPVPVPSTELLCPDPDVIGAPFYLMSHVDGVVYRSRTETDPLGDDGRRDLAYAMMDVLAALHSVDPAAVGLGDFGHPDGFLARQVRRWSGQLDKSRSRPLPGVDALRDRLAASVPPGTWRAGLVHGDYRLDNLMCAPDAPRVRAVLDWEMATLGDPLTDLGLLLTYWDVLGGASAGAARGVVAEGLGSAAGFPSGAELIKRYAAGSPVDVRPLNWHVALGCFKLAVIAEGIYYRYQLGQTVGEGFERFALMADPLVEHGLTALEEN